MTFNTQLTPYDGSFQIIEDLSIALSKFADSPRDPGSIPVVEKIKNLIQSNIKELRDDVNRNPKHAIIWKDICINIRRLHTIDSEFIAKTQGAIAYIVQATLPIPLQQFDITDHSITILICELNSCLDSIIEGKEIEKNLKYGARLLVTHFKLFREVNLSGQPLNQQQKEKVQKILNFCKEQLRRIAQTHPSIASQPFFQNLVKLVFNRLETKSWHTRLEPHISADILSYLPMTKECYSHILEFQTKHRAEGNRALAEWINNNHISLSKLSLTPESITPLLPYLKYLNFETIDVNIWTPEVLYETLQNCLKMNALYIRNHSEKMYVLPPRTQRLTHLLCSGSIQPPAAMPHLQLLICNSKIKSLPSEMPSLRKLVCKGTNCNYVKLPRGMISLEELDCTGCGGLKNLPGDLESLRKLILNGCQNIESIPENLINLRVLYCRDVPIEKLPNGMKFLKVLNCAGTNLMALPQGMVSLEYLNSSGCLLTYPDDLVSLKQDGIYSDSLATIPKKYAPFIKSIDFSTHWDLRDHAILDVNGNIIE